MHEILQVSKLGTDNVTQESGAVLGLKFKTTLCCSDMQITREGGGVVGKFKNNFSQNSTNRVNIKLLDFKSNFDIIFTK